LDSAPGDGVSDCIDVLGRELVKMIPEVLAVEFVLVEIGVKVERCRIDPLLDFTL
jgi:hypothetical protein